MKIVEIKVYQYDELTPKAKEKAREWYRGCMTGDSYQAQFIIEEATGFLNVMGFDIKNIYYNGFYSQGDGACFVGKWEAFSFKEGIITKEVGPEDKILPIAKEFERLAKICPFATVQISHKDHYYHEKSVDYDLDSGAEYSEDKIGEDIWHSFCEDFQENCRRAMRWIYTNLQNEYEDRHKDETIAENIRANEYEFREDGSRFV